MIILIQKISQILFEPVSIVALLGLCLYLFFHWRRKDCRFWLICSSIFFLFGWRIIAHSVMASKRYWEILIYPGIIFACYFCVQFPHFLRWILCKTGPFHVTLHYKIYRILSWLCVIGLTVSCLIKAFLINTYSSYIVRLCDVFKKDSAGRNIVHICTNSKELARIMHYCNISPEKCMEFSLERKHDPYQTFCDRVYSFSNKPGVYYFFRVKGKKEKELSIADAGIRSEHWKELAREYTSRRKNKEMILYRFTPPRENIKEWTGQIPKPKKSELIKLYDFETGGREKKFDSIAQGIGHKAFSKKVLVLPDGWNLDYDKNNPAPLPFLTVSDFRPLEGKKSLLLERTQGAQDAWCYSYPFTTKKNYSFSLFVRGNSEPVSNIMFKIRGEDGKNRAKHLLFSIYKDKLYRINWTIHSKDFPADTKTFIVMIGVTSGSVSVDQIEIRTF